MDYRKGKGSVIARLMCLDELPPPSIQKTKRVLSENYLRRVALIGAVKKRSFRECHSVKTGLKEKKAFEFGSEVVKFCRGDEYVDPKRSDSSSCFSLNTMPQTSFRDPPQFVDPSNDWSEENKPNTISFFSDNVDDLQLKSGFSHFGDNVVLKGITQLSGGCHDTATPQFVLKNDIFSSHTENFTSKLLHGKSAERYSCVQTSHSGPTKCSELSGPDMLRARIEVKDHDSKWRNKKAKNGRNGLEDPYLNRFSKQQIKYEGFRRKWGLRSDKTTLDLARLKVIKCNSDEKSSSEARGVKLKSATSNSLASWDSEDSHSHSDMKDNNSLQSKRKRKHEVKNKLDGCDINKLNLVIVDTETAMELSGKSEIEQLGSTSSCATDGSLEQSTPIGFDEESSMVPNCNGMEIDPTAIFMEDACHPSPISVLEQPFGEEGMYASEILVKTMYDICDLRRHLELLKSETSETYLEEPEMAVSSDDENEEGLSMESIDNKAFMKVCRVDESKKFSYLVDVLDEASLDGVNFTEFSTWHSLDCPISRLVFETLEKKYGDQISWKMSERSLLFDRMNAGLTEIVLPHMAPQHALEKSVSRRFSSTRYEETLEEDLWKLLVFQEKECSKYTMEKMVESELGKLDLGDEIDAIGREIERLLFDELLAEFF